MCIYQKWCMEQYVKPMGLGEILDASVKLYRKNFWNLVIAKSPMVAIYLIIIGLNLYFLGTAGTTFFDMFSRTPMSSYPVYPTTPAAPDLVTTLYFTFVILVLSLVQLVFVYPVSMSAVTKIASDSILKNPLSLKKAYIFSLKNWFKLGVTHIIVSIIIGIITLIAAILPAIIIFFALESMSTAYMVLGFIVLGAALLAPGFLIIRWITVFPVMVNEQKFIGDAMSRSWDMVKGHTLKILVAMIILGLLPFLVQYTPSIFEFLVNRKLIVLTVLFGALAQGIITPLVDCERAVVYFELRARKEGFDLEKRVEQLD